MPNVVSSKKGKLATIAQIAKVPFNPVPLGPDELPRPGQTLKPSNETMIAAAELARLARFIVSRSKDQLVTSVAEMESRLFEQLVDDLGDVADQMDSIAQMCRAAECRVMSAGGVLTRTKRKGVRRAAS